MGTKAEHEEIVALYRAGRLYEANQAARRIVAAERGIVSPVTKSVPVKTGVKSGITKPVREIRTAQILSAIIFRETGQKVGCSSCSSSLAKLNRLSTADTLIQLETIADEVLRSLNTPVEKIRVKAWICEAVEGTA